MRSNVAMSSGSSAAVVGIRQIRGRSRPDRRRASSRTWSSRRRLAGSIWKPPPPIATIVRRTPSITLPLQPDGGWPIPVEHVDRVDEADLLGLIAHHERMGPRAAAEEADAL